MSGIRYSRNFVLVALLGVSATIVVLLMFYGQYRLLADGVLADSLTQHEAFLRESFERRARFRMRVVAEDFGDAEITPDEAERILEQALARTDGLVGLRLSGLHEQSIAVGETEEIDSDASVTWNPDSLSIRYPLRRDDGAAMLTGAFLLDEYRAEAEVFEVRLTADEAARTRTSYLSILVGTLATVIACGVVVWIIARNQSLRIRELKRQAERMSAADFGEPLDASHDDEIGELAAVFNAMRERLRKTTLSRDYVDSILASMNDAIIVTAGDSTIKRINRATTHLLGYESDELVGTPIEDLVDSVKKRSLRKDSSAGLPHEAFFMSKFDESIPVSYTCSVLEGKEAESGDRIYAAQNVTERRRAEQRIRYLARIDSLTRIPNRMQFQHLLQQAIARAKRAGQELCLFYIDIDNFKDINDTFGHLAGDTTLETVAERLSEELPDETVIGRLAGDEFAVIVADASPKGGGRARTSQLASRLLAKLAEPFVVQGHEVFMTASMGIAYYPEDAPNVIDLIRNADAALYHAKKNGGNAHSYYEPRMNEAAVERLMTRSKLKRAFERDELLVHYQPKYNLETGEVAGAEALVRWDLPERGVILPSDFIPIAEETNLIIEIGEWVLDKVCEDFRFWQRSVSSPGRVSVNLSLKQLRQANFTKRISSIMRSYELSPTSLELEITETTLMENPERTIKLLDQLYAIGLHLAIDDFGTGYSSLSALQQFPISTLKIDKSFVRHVSTDPDDATLVSTIVQMGRNLRLDVVAEGVESEDQLNFLQSTGCTYAQGLLFGDPMSSDSYLELLLAQAEGTDQYRTLFVADL